MDKRVKHVITQRFSPDIYTVYAVYDGGDRYIIAVKKKGSDSPSLDPFYTVNKQNLVIKGFLPHQELDFFNYARQHPIEW